jgi:calcineurin-like phosphoesterase family protein
MSNNIWFTSDSHFHHKNIVRGVTSWEIGEGEVGTRDFDTLEEHDEALVKSFNSVIKENDILYHLGDWSFGGHEQIKIFRDKLRCKNIHLIFGNHDQHIEPINSPYRSLFSSLGYYKEISLNVDKKWDQFRKVKICMSHYAMRVWNKSHHGAIMLYGQSHGTLEDNGTRSMDVGVDTNALYPYHLDEVLEIMLKRKVHTIDHHNSSTN